MVKLRRVCEYNCFESDKDKEDLKKYLGDDLYNDYMKIRNKIPKDQNDYKDFQKLKNLPIKDVQSFVNNFQSETDKRKEAKKGGKEIYNDSDWTVIRITTYPAAKYYGSGTKWCITGRYPGHEELGPQYFQDYIEDNVLDGGYYFCIDKHNPNRKYCILRYENGDIHSIWDATDSEIQDVDKSEAPDDLPLSIPYKGFDLGYAITEYLEEYAGSNYDPLESLANELSKGPEDWNIDRIDNFVDVVSDYGVEDFDYYYEILCPQPPMKDDRIEAFEILLREYVPTQKFLETHSLGNTCYDKLIKKVLSDPESYDEDYFDFFFKDMVGYYCEKDFPITKDLQSVLGILKNCSDDIINNYDSGCSISDIVHAFNKSVIFSKEFLSECFKHGLTVSDLIEDDIPIELLKYCVKLGLVDLNDTNCLSDNFDKRTVFMEILYNMNPSIEDVKWLLNHGANPNIKDKDGDTAVEYTDNPKIIELLSE